MSIPLVVNFKKIIIDLSMGVYNIARIEFERPLDLLEYKNEIDYGQYKNLNLHTNNLSRYRLVIYTKDAVNNYNCKYYKNVIGKDKFIDSILYYKGAYNGYSDI